MKMPRTAATAEHHGVKEDPYSPAVSPCRRARPLPHAPVQPLLLYAVVNEAGHISHVNLTEREAKTAVTRGFGQGSGAWDRIAAALGLFVVPVRVSPPNGVLCCGDQKDSQP
jgi:hypothetical protein